MRRIEERRRRDDVDFDLGEFLRRRYELEGATQEQIAAELGVDGSTITRWMAAFDIETRLFASERPTAQAVA